MPSDLRQDIEQSAAAQDAAKLMNLGPFKYHLSVGGDLSEADAKRIGFDEDIRQRFNAALEYQRAQTGGGATIAEDLKRGLEEQGLGAVQVPRQGEDVQRVVR